jgi:hypothetical protein
VVVDPVLDGEHVGRDARQLRVHVREVGRRWFDAV